MNNLDSSPHQNWLRFSLSNHHHLPTSSPHSSHLSLFQAFHSTTSPGINVVDTPRDEDASTGATDLSIFSSDGPKLEDFLGGGGGGGGSTTGVAAPSPPPPPPPPPPPQQLGQFSTENHVTVSDTEIYDCELKTIAASFLRGFSTEQADSQKQQQPLVAEPTLKKTVDTFGQRTSIYRGVTRHRWTGRYEAHLWDNSCRREGQSRKGRQVYLGGYDKEEKAARAYDLAALKYWGPTTTTNFPVGNYEKELEEMKNMTRQEFVASLRRKSSGFSRGASIYRGVTRHHQHGRWQARIGRVAGNKDLYLGTFSTQEEAAEAYDIAAIKFRGLNAVTNFDMSRYDVKSIANSNLPIGGMSAKQKNSSDSASDNKSSIDGSSTRSADDPDLSSASTVTFASQPAITSTLNFAIPIKTDPSDQYWSNILGYNHNAKNNPPVSPPFFSAFQNPTPFNMDLSGNNSSVPESNSIGLFNGNGYFQQQSSIPFATPIALNSTIGNSSYEGTGSGSGSWINAPSLHSFQPAKPNISVFQTPIFGME